MNNCDYIKENYPDIFSFYSEVVGFYREQLDLIRIIEDKNQDEIFYEAIVLQYATYSVELLESIFLQMSNKMFMVSNVSLRSLFEYFVTLEYIKKDKINRSKQYVSYVYKQKKTFGNVLRNKKVPIFEENYEQFDKEMDESFEVFRDDIKNWLNILEQRAIKSNLKDMYDLLYRPTSSIAHPTALSLLSFYESRKDNQLVIDTKNSSNVSNLVIGILLCNHIMASFNEQFRLSESQRYVTIDRKVNHLIPGK